MKRYLVLFAAALAAGAVLLVAARTMRPGAGARAGAAPVPTVTLDLVLTADGVSPSVSAVPKDHRVRLSVTNRRRGRVGLSLQGYQDLLEIGWIEPDSTWRGEFIAERPGDDFAWMLEGEPVGRLCVQGSHLVEGHR